MQKSRGAINILVFLAFVSVKMWSQEKIFDDSPYKALENSLNLTQDDSIKQSISDKYLLKAKSDGDVIRIADGYVLKIKLHSHTKKAVAYADSILLITQNLNEHDKYPAEGFLQRGIQRYYLSKHNEALDDFVKANEFFIRQENEFKKLVIRHYIALLKTVTDEDDESLNILRGNMVFFNSDKKKEKFNDQYLKSLFALANSYNTNNKYDSAIFISKIGLKESAKRRDKYLHHFFLLTSGSSHLMRKNYLEAQENMKAASYYIKEKKTALAQCYYNLSYAFLSDDKKEKGLHYLKKVDSMYLSGNSQVILVAKASYEVMLSEYGDLLSDNEKLIIIEKLLQTNEIAEDEYQNLDKRISYKFDSAVLLDEKELIISKLKLKERKAFFTISLLALLLLMLLYLSVKYYRHKVTYRKRYEDFIKKAQKEKDEKRPSKTRIRAESQIPLSKNLVEGIIQGLESFEENKSFINNSYSLAKLAKELDTNTSYLSKAINTYKGMNFSNYMSELRINYAIEKLNTDEKFRQYTIEAIAIEVGFNRAQSFSKAFYKRTGLLPGEFISQLKEGLKKRNKENNIKNISA